MKYSVAYYKALIFDFDGVVIDSENYKIAAFKSIFDAYPKHIKEIDYYNRKNRGITRFKKFEYIFENILRLPYNPKTETELATRYSQELAKNIDKVPLIKGVRKFLQNQKMLMFIASSAPENEIDRIVRLNYIKRYFKKIFAHPISKPQAIKRILKEERLKPFEACFFGDAPIDLESANNVGVDFIARTEASSKFPKGTRYILSFTELLAL